ncbi:LCP family protein [Streptococcus suis]|nr:LCP family protein [Streptococcus suis]
MKIGTKILLMFLSILALTIGAGAIYTVTFLNYSTGEIAKTFRSIGNREDEGIIEATEPLAILLMGVDTDQATRGLDWEEGRSDSMILVTVNPLTKKTTMMSLTRDIMVEIANKNGRSSDKIEKLNHSYAYGQAAMSIATIEKMMDITINRYVEINMDGLVELVDAIGGIKVNNTLGFPITIDEYEPAYTAVVPPGEQLVNGDQALVYARMRYDDPEGDIGRQKRQREVIQALVTKLLQLDGFTQYKKILKAVSKHMRTDIVISNSTIPSLLGYKDALNQVESYQLGGEGHTIDELSYQIPTAAHVLEMQNVLKESLGLPKVSKIKTNIKVLEYLFGQSSPIEVINAYTNDIEVEANGETYEPETAPTYDIDYSQTETSKSRDSESSQVETSSSSAEDGQ